LLDLNFSVPQIATTGKLCGSIGAIIGGIIGGYLMQRFNIIQSLLYFGAIHTSAHLLLALQAIVGNNLLLYFITSISESVTGGMAMAAYIAFITSICRGKYKATQQGFFTSMMGVSRSIFPSLSGFMASTYGWLNFFLISFGLSIPALIILFYMRKSLEKYLYSRD
jgi:PAT family beta-lactamase induction signal transducer AmpG